MNTIIDIVFSIISFILLILVYLITTMVNSTQTLINDRKYASISNSSGGSETSKLLTPVIKYELITTITSKNVLLFDYINDFRKLVVRNITSYIFTCIFGKNKVKNINLIKDKIFRSYDDMFILWMFDANMENKLVNYIPTDNIVNKENILYTLAQEGSIDVDLANKCIDKWNTSTYFNALTNLRKNIRENIPCKIELLKNNGKYTFIRTIIDSGIRNIDKQLKIHISNVQYNRLWQLYNMYYEKIDELNDSFIENAYFITAKYNLLGGINNNLSVPDIVDATIFNTNNTIIAKHRLDYVELFGSPLNTRTDNYCSPFIDEKEIFGSKGSFFNYELTPGVYMANPPFDNNLMLKMAERLVDQLNKATGATFVIITLPVWDPETQEKLKVKNYKTPFPAFDLLSKSEFLQAREVLTRDYKYYNYFTESYSHVTASHLLLLSNQKVNGVRILTEIKNSWRTL